MATDFEIKRIWALLGTAYPTYAKEQSTEMMAQTLRLYQRLLADIPGEMLEAAALQHVASSRFFPTIAELREIAVAIMAPPSTTPMEAWGKLQAAMADVRFYRYADGYHEFPHFDDPILERVVQDMGWANLTASEDTVADRARFLQAYEAYARRMREDQMLLPAVRELAQTLHVDHQPPALSAGEKS